MHTLVSNVLELRGRVCAVTLMNTLYSPRLCIVKFFCIFLFFTIPPHTAPLKLPEVLRKLHRQHGNSTSVVVSARTH